MKTWLLLSGVATGLSPSAAREMKRPSDPAKSSAPVNPSAVSISPMFPLQSLTTVLTSAEIPPLVVTISPIRPAEVISPDMFPTTLSDFRCATDGPCNPRYESMNAPPMLIPRTSVATRKLLSWKSPPTVTCPIPPTFTTLFHISPVTFIVTTLLGMRTSLL